MNTILLLSCVFLNIYSVSLNSPIGKIASHESVIQKIFNHEEVPTKLSHQKSILETFTMLHTVPLRTVIVALQKVIHLLSLQEIRYETLPSLSQQDKIAQVIISIQKTHMLEYITSIYERFSIWQKIFFSIYKHTTQFITSLIKVVYRPYESSSDTLAYHIEWYTFFEREHLLNDYQTALHFFVQQKKSSYPKCLAWWKNHSNRLKLLPLLHQLDTITPQMEALMTMGKAAADTVIGFVKGMTMQIAKMLVKETVQEGKTIAEDLAEAAGKDAEDIAVLGAKDEVLQVAEQSESEVGRLSESVESEAPGTDAAMESSEKEVEDVASEDESLLENPEDEDDDLESFMERNKDRLKASTKVSERSSADDDYIAYMKGEGDDDLSLAEDGGEGVGKDIGEDAGEDEGEDEAEMKLTGKERMEEIAAKRAEKIAALKSTLKDPKAGFLKKAGARLKLGWMKIMKPYDAVADRLDAYVGSKASNAYTSKFGKFLKKVENNPVRRAIKALPPSWQGIAEMMIQMEVMQATSLVAFWYEQDFEEEYAKWQKKQEEMTTLNSKQTALMTVQQNQNLTLANQTFIAYLNTLSQAKQKEFGVAAFSQRWMEQAIFSSPPSSYFTQQAASIGNNNIPAITTDYQFQLSTMLTPESTRTGTFIPTAPNAWHNVYRNGNWQFLAPNNTFCQLTLVPVNGTGAAAQALQVLANTIFRDYVPRQQLSYSVSASFTLHTYQFPFFIGLLFNKGRWISGVPDKEHQVRFAGLYGVSKNKIYFVCEESKNSTSAEIQQGAPSTQSPFYRILNNPSQYTVEKNLFPVDPLPCAATISSTSYDMTHPTLATTLQATITKTDTPKTSCSVTNATASPNNGLQHGIGFVCAGCIGTFSIQSPQNVTYTQNDLALMTKNLAIIQGGV